MPINGELVPVSDYGLYKNITVDTLIKTGPGALVGVIVNSHTSGTLKMWDNTSAATTVIFNTITFGATERFMPFYGAKFTVGCYADIGGTVDLTIIYN